MKTEITMRTTERLFRLLFILLVLFGVLLAKSFANDTCSYVGDYLYQNQFIDSKKEIYPESGTITITAPANALLSYEWDNGSTFARRSGLVKGIYTLTVTDATGCSDTLDIEVQGMDDMLAHYPFNKNADNAMGTGHNGTLVGASDTTNRFGEDSTAYYFNAAELDYIELGDSLKPMEFPISMFAWVYLDSLTNDGQHIIRTDQWSNIGRYAGVKMSIGKDGKLSANFGTGKGAGSAHRFGKTSLDSIPIIGKWSCVGAVFYSATDISLFLNGQELEGGYAGNASTMGYTSSKGAIGYSANGRGYFAGCIDDIRFYDMAFSADEVSDLYRLENRSANIEAGLIRYYPCNGDVQNVINETYNGDSINAMVSDRVGLDDQCFAFDYTHYLVLPTIGNWGNYLSMSVWFKADNPNTGANKSMIVNSRTSDLSGYANFELAIENTDSTASWNIWGTNVNHVGVKSTNKVKVGEWNHVVVMSNLETNTMTIILNGEVTTETGVLVPRYKTANIFLGGVYAQYSQAPNGFIGKIDEFRIYKRILSDAEWDLLYAQEFEMGENYKLMAHYPLNEDANDISGNENHGSVYGAVSTDRNLIPRQAFETDGTNNITIPSLGNWGNELTISMWVKGSVLDYPQYILGNRQGTSGSTKINILGSIQPDSTVGIMIHSDATTEPWLYTTNKIEPNAWNHVVFEQDRTNESISIILNGVRSSITYTNSPRYLNLPLGIGNFNNAYYNETGFIGKIDEVRIYQRILSANEKEALWNQHFPDTNNMNDYQICFGDSVLINGNYYAEQGIIIDTLTSTQGTDSMVVSNLVVNPLPEPLISGNDTLCYGQGTLLTASGGDSYLWSNLQNGSFIQVTPTTTEKYWVEVTNAFGCKATDSIQIKVNELPVIDIIGNSTLCKGDTIVLHATGGDTYVWNTGVEMDSIVIMPLVQTTYSVIGTDNKGCKNATEVEIVVNSLPTVTISGEVAICQGETAVLTAEGAEAYLWSSVSQDASITVSPDATHIYTVLGTDINGCRDTATHMLTVNALPEIDFQPGLDSVCLGNSDILLVAIPAGGLFSGTGVEGEYFSPANATVGIHEITYAYTDANQCSNTASNEIKVVNCSTNLPQQIAGNVKVYPNPASDLISIELDVANNCQVSIFGSNGTLVYKNNHFNSGQQIDISAMESGIYILKIYNENMGSIISQLVVK